jgi:hypothetical protein
MQIQPQNRALHPFLYAEIGPEPSGMTLSVLSALARLDVDPWEEATRLTKLPRQTATAVLTRMIAHIPGAWSPAETPAIALRLAALLPRGLEPAASASTELLPRERQWMVPAGLIATLLVGLLLSVGFQDKHPAPIVQDQTAITGG